MRKILQIESPTQNMASRGLNDDLTPDIVELSEYETDQIGGGPEVINNPTGNSQ